MFIDENSLYIKKQGGEYLNLAPYLTQVEYGYNKLWGDDTGRNLAGVTTGTFKGIVVKLKLSFGELTREELETISPILNAPWQVVKFYSPDEQELVEIQTYTGDWATLNRNSFFKVARANEAFDISVIATTPQLSTVVVPPPR